VKSIDALHTIVANAVWPYERFGLLGLPLGVVYLPIVVPLTSLVVVINCLPIVQVIVASIRHTATLLHHGCTHRSGVQLLPVRHGRQAWSEETLSDDDDRVSTSVFQIESLLGRCYLEDTKDRSPSDEIEEVDDATKLEDMVEHIKRRRVSHFAFVENNDITGSVPTTDGLSFLRSISLTVTSSPITRTLLPVLGCIVYVGAVTGASLLISECVGFVTKLLAFTAMGVFANAEHLMKYFALIVVVAVYIRDCFMVVHGRFLRLNRAVFAELKSRIPDLERVTSLPSHLQQNTAFRPVQQTDFVELSTVAADVRTGSLTSTLSIGADAYSNADILKARETVSSSALFVDRNDQPMIPRLLFDQVGVEHFMFHKK